MYPSRLGITEEAPAPILSFRGRHDLLLAFALPYSFHHLLLVCAKCVSCPLTMSTKSCTEMAIGNARYFLWVVAKPCIVHRASFFSVQSYVAMANGEEVSHCSSALPITEVLIREVNIVAGCIQNTVMGRVGGSCQQSSSDYMYLLASPPYYSAYNKHRGSVTNKRHLHLVIVPTNPERKATVHNFGPFVVVGVLE